MDSDDISYYYLLKCSQILVHKMKKSEKLTNIS